MIFTARRFGPPQNKRRKRARSCRLHCDEARAAAKAGLAPKPSFTVRRFHAGAASDNAKYLAGRERIVEGMRIAGVPER
jgi:hypothetical protein